MLKERIDLENILYDIIIQNNSNSRIYDIIEKLFIEKGISIGDLNDLWSMRKPLNSIDMLTFFVFTKGLYEATKNGKIKLEEWFTETEIKDGNNFIKEINKDIISFPLIISEVLKGKDDQYMTYMPAIIIKKWYDSQLITYNFETQRNPKYRQQEKDGELIKVANINTNSVNEIANDIDNNDFITNCITLNILQDGTDRIEYTRKRELIIHSGQINPIDGFHRIQGMIKAIAENPNIDYITEVRFTNWDIQKCRNFIYQEDKRNKIDKRYMNSIINVNKMSNKVVTLLNEGRSDLKGKITTDIIYLNKNKALTMFDLLSDSINEVYNLKTNINVIQIKDWLEKFFDIIIGTYPDAFIDNVDKIKTESVINLPAIFIGYIGLSKELYGMDDWEDKLIKILDNIDFSLNNPIWEEIGIIRNKKPVVNASKPTIKKIIEYFRKEVNKW